MSRLKHFVRLATARKSIWCSVVAFSLLAGPLFADVEVTLKSGVTIVENEAVVKVDDAELKVPLSQVESISAVGTTPDRQAQRLLLSALAIKLTKDGNTEVIGLLAEASRLAPTDPYIAYWYATSLADAGYGQAASDIFTKQREAIAVAYPGLTDQLAERIKKRVEMEKMPPALVERLDALNKLIAKQAPNAEMRQLAAVFRLVDQEELAIEQADFQIHANGQDENLESYDDGYFVYTYNLNRGNEEQPCHLDILRPGLESKTFDFGAASNRVHDAGKLTVKRYAEDAMKPVRILLTDAAGVPVVAAQVSIQAMSSRGSQSNHTLTGETDAEGRASIMAFPMKYSYQVRAEGFNSVNGTYDLRPDSKETDEIKLQVYRAIEATIRLAWESTSPQGGGKTSGESTLNVGNGAPQNQHYGQDPAPWLRASQQKDRLTLQFVDSPYGYQGPIGGGEAWVRVIDSKGETREKECESMEVDAKADESQENEDTQGDAQEDEVKEEVEKQPATLDQFNALDLDEIDDFKKKLRQPRMLGGGEGRGPRPPMVLPAEVGPIYIGRVQHRDMRTGQPIQLAFKVFVEEMESGDEAKE